MKDIRALVRTLELALLDMMPRALCCLRSTRVSAQVSHSWLHRLLPQSFERSWELHQAWRLLLQPYWPLWMWESSRWKKYAANELNRYLGGSREVKVKK